jgi:hypothetical protein
MTYELQASRILHKMGYRQDAGYKKGWYQIITNEDTKNLTQKELEIKSLGVLYCGADGLQIIKDELGI